MPFANFGNGCANTVANCTAPIAAIMLAKITLGSAVTTATAVLAIICPILNALSNLALSKSICRCLRSNCSFCAWALVFIIAILFAFSSAEISSLFTSSISFVFCSSLAFIWS